MTKVLRLHARSFVLTSQKRLAGRPQGLMAVLSWLRKACLPLLVPRSSRHFLAALLIGMLGILVGGPQRCKCTCTGQVLSPPQLSP